MSAVPDSRPDGRLGADAERARPAAGARPGGRGARAAAAAGCGPSRSGRPEVLRLEHLAEPLGAPVGDQELQPGLGAQPAVPVVAEDADDAGPHLGHLVDGDERAEPLGQVRVRRQPAADPDVEAGAVLGVPHADERQVVDLVRDVLVRRAADRRLELARQVRELRVADVPPVDLLDRGRAVDDLVGVDAGDRRAEDHARGVAAGLCGGRARRDSSRSQIAGTSSTRIQCSCTFCRSVRSAVSRPYVVETSATARSCGRVSRPPSTRMRSMKNGASSSSGSMVRGPTAVDALGALGVQPPPAEPAAQVAGVDRGEAPVAVDVLDAGPDVEPVVVLLGPLVGVQRLVEAQRPLPFAARAARPVAAPRRGGATAAAEVGAAWAAGLVMCRVLVGAADARVRRSNGRGAGAGRSRAPGGWRAAVREPSDKDGTPYGTRA